MRKLLSTLLVAVLLFTAAYKSLAEEGMWIPMLLGSMNESDMVTMGMRITAEDIYSINNSSLKDAVVIFGGGCTGEIVSNEGLLLTNHHCGFGSIQRHSTIEHNYLDEGFWAMSRDEELSSPWLTCTMLVRMEEVTDQVLKGVTNDMTEKERQDTINENIKKIRERAVEGTHYEAIIKPFYYGNQYFMFINEVFKDIRLVGAPPSNIGKFGGDTDNWMWPRHTGDFSVFRIYVNEDNEPAEYSGNNIPYTPKTHMKISLKGADKGDFTFVFGYPGSTQEYLPSYAIEMITEVENPIRIDLRTIALDIIGSAMNQSDEIRLQYAAKQAGIANGWKKWIGENRGIKRLDAVTKKQIFEKEFQEWAKSSDELEAQYGGIIPRFSAIYAELSPLMAKENYLWETGFRVELIRFANAFRSLVQDSKAEDLDQEKVDKAVSSLNSRLEGHFKDYNLEIDKKMFIALFAEYISRTDLADRPDIFVEMQDKYGNDIAKYAEKLYSKSMFASEEKCAEFLSGYKASKYKKIEKDPAFVILQSFRNFYFDEILPKSGKYEAEIDSLMRFYMRAQMEMQPEKRFYPDANFTLRVTYGKVDDYFPRDAVHYTHFTTLEGIIEKEDPDIYDYKVEGRLKELYNTKDYGRYADEDGSMHVCFTASNHTTGGNSGSPILNADGHLLGINFDRNWEGTMSDLMYDPDMCRNISIDIRYLLFIIDKFAGAGHLIEEMTLVE